MTTLFSLVLILILFFSAYGNNLISNIHKKLSSSHLQKEYSGNVQALIDRVLLRANIPFRFVPILEIIDYEEIDGLKYDVFEIDSANGQIVFRGTNGVALSAAFGHYVRQYTNCDFHWEDGGGYSFGAFPKQLSDLPVPTQKERIVFLSQWRYYQNTCTASYSYPWKNWTQWEADIDWMAMSGINLPLAFTGQEIVWQKLWRQYGVSDEGLQQYFTGPAFLTWQRMANLRAFAGPLSDSWIQQQADLQEQILQRYSELGMTPVLPAFNGVVPEEMTKLFPNASITQLSSWDDFEEQYSCNYIVSSTDPLFVDIGKAFLNLQFEMFGEVSKSHIYNCDTFNENKPASSDATYLSSSSSAVYKSMVEADPEAIWLMQGWLFVDSPSFWTDDAIAAYLSGVPNDGLIVLDLTSDNTPVWDKIAANHKPFIWCMLHNYGGSRALYGNLTLLANNPIQVQSEASQYFLGTGLTMEAINQNPVVYEFMTEMAYRRSVPDVYSWVSNYAIRRYGLEVPEVSTESKNALLIAWKQFYENNYNGEDPFCSLVCWDRTSLISREPTWDALQERTTQAGPLVDIWTLFLSAKLPNSHENYAFTYDLIDIGRQVMGNLFNDYFHFTKAFYNRFDVRNYQIFMNELLQLISLWDQLLATHESYLVGKWVSEAVRWAKDEDEKDLFAYNAKNQITLWGPNGEISDYASKNWAGLVKEYYLPRWKLFLTMSYHAVLHNRPVNEDVFDELQLNLGRSFCNTSIEFSTEPVGCPIKLSQDAHSIYGNGYQSVNKYEVFENQNFDGLILNDEEQPTWTSNINQLKRICDLIEECVGFTSQGLLKSSVTKVIPNQQGITTYLKKRSSA